MLGSSDLVANTVDGADEKGGPTAGGGSGNSSAGFGVEFYEGDRSTGGNRWPRQETLALLKIRSDMDAAFRDSSLKGPLWEEISRKMVEQGYNRSGKKCKEKFENVYKYHKRTKEGRVAKADGKTYRFFDQLEAFDHHHHPPPEEEAIPVTMVMPLPAASINHHHQQLTVTSIGCSNIIQQQQQMQSNQIPQSQSNPISSSRSESATPSSSSSTDVDKEAVVGRKRKRNWKELFERMANEVMDKQEELHSRMMADFENREHRRVLRDEAWKAQEIARLKRENESLVRERSMAAAKDAALISFLQKIAEQRNMPFPHSLQSQPPQQPQSPPPRPTPQEAENGENSRWPKAEVDALIKLRSGMEGKYQENNPKGPLWEEISAAMKKMGYSKSSKRCKEKWENINKYFKKVKESNKRRKVDSKTCPYFDQLDALYRHNGNSAVTAAVAAYGAGGAGQIEAQQSDEFEDGEDDEEEEEESGYEIVANNVVAGGGGGLISGAGTAAIATATTTTATPE